MLLRPWLVLSLLHSLSKACRPDLNTRAENDQGFPATEPGPDTPPSPSTAGYFVNHAALNVCNLTRSVAWYRDVLGFQVLFTFRASPRYSVVYLGHSTRIGDTGLEYQTATELTEAMISGSLRGLLELVHFDRSDLQEENEQNLATPTRFGHLGLMVPDLLQAQERLETLGKNVLKRAGELPDLRGPVGEAYGLPGDTLRNEEEARLISEALLNVLLVLDPDGNLVEVQSLSGRS